MFYRLPFLINSLLTCCLYATTETGDFLVNSVTAQYQKALCDNGTHAIVAAFSWMIVCVWSRYKNVNQLFIESLTCGIIGSAIDLDHFLAARSTNLKVFSICILYSGNCTIKFLGCYKFT